MTQADTSTPPALAKTFDPAAIEAKWSAHWEANGLFRPDRPDAPPFTIVNPPPNVTGSLHIGHALDNTLQDIVVRYERLRGKDALWVVGTDHAGIATQMVVERELESRQDKRINYTREEFVGKVWEWKAQSGGVITEQLRRLGCSMDWSREQFTMDAHFSRAVTKAFVDLYNQGLIYRDKRLVNWDPKLKTAISDIEVETREIKGHFWHIRYPLADGVQLDSGADHIVVATTRPETMLADMAVAVNATDPRYRSVIGAFVTLPITGRCIPIIADDHADPALGSGAVKITPGHDFNDFEVGKRAGIAPAQMLNMFDVEANVVQVADGLIPDWLFPYRDQYGDKLGMERFEARRAMVTELKKLELLVTFNDNDGHEKDAEDRLIQTPFGDRSGVIIEPWLTDQWYVNAAELAKAPMQAVRDERIEIIPKSWERTFFNWMDNIQPWCVSRQLWWGHRMPAWYGPNVDTVKQILTEYGSNLDSKSIISGHIDSKSPAFVRNDENGAIESATHFYRSAGCEITAVQIKKVDEHQSWRMVNGTIFILRDPDVLDTWFSSALWPFATLGWPEAADLPSRLREGPGVGTSGLARASEQEPTPNPSRKREGNLLARHYPNDLSIAGFDILFFWCARMAMQGMHFMDDVPWRRLYLHGLVRAADGQKMSKSKGNVVDPLVLIDKYGADALRFFMAAMESQGRDVKMDERRLEGYRNFATKLWNAARFCQANGIGASTSLAAPAATLAVNQWIIGEVVETLAQLDKAMAELRFDAAADAIYHFVWDQLCDWYLELIKPVFSPLPLAGGAGGGHFSDGEMPTPNPSRKREGDETRAVAGWVLDQILVMLHPFMPFVTEELWSALGARENELIVARWPEPQAIVDITAKAEIDWLTEIVNQIRTTRTEINVPAAAVLQFGILSAPAELYPLFDKYAVTLRHLARIQLVMGIEWQVQIVAAGATLVIAVSKVIDVATEKARLEKAMSDHKKNEDTLLARLQNPAFIDKAKVEAVEKARADYFFHATEAARLAAACARLG